MTIDKTLTASVIGEGFNGIVVVNNKGIISYAPPIANGWIGLKWTEFVRFMFLKDNEFNYQLAERRSSKRGK